LNRIAKQLCVFISAPFDSRHGGRIPRLPEVLRSGRAAQTGASRLCRCQCRLGSLTDQLPLMLGHNALVPALIVEELEDGSYTVLVPSVPTPMAGAIYILPGEFTPLTYSSRRPERILEMGNRPPVSSYAQ
jgi:hypothetical protein